jgi:hypothetical protein
MALYYAYGPYRIRNIRPKSAFSRGDVVQYDSASSLSYANPLIGTSEYAGVALSSSTESYRSKVPYVVIQPGTGFWTTIAVGSAVSEGFPYDLVPVSGDWEIATSSTTPRVVVSKDQTNADVQRRNTESADSWVIVEFYTSADSGTVRVGTVFGG